jgi:hypothetical protein
MDDFVPEADRAEQEQEVAPPDDLEVNELPTDDIEVDEADALDQARSVPYDDPEP